MTNNVLKLTKDLFVNIIGWVLLSLSAVWFMDGIKIMRGVLRPDLLLFERIYVSVLHMLPFYLIVRQVEFKFVLPKFLRRKK